MDANIIPKILQIAREAGDAILKVYALYNAKSTENNIFITKKADESPLTEADLSAHAIIATQLKHLTPDIPVVSEEDQISWSLRDPKRTFWIVDPLDGTKEFLARNGEFTVNIGLVKNGVAVFGVIFAPVLNEMYWGGEFGAFCERDGKIKKIHVSKANKLSPLRIIVSARHLTSEIKDLILKKFGEYILMKAGSSLKFCRVAEGSADIYPRLGATCEWDTAAGQAIVEAAGGSVVQLDGSALRYGKQDILNPSFIVQSGRIFF